MKLIILATGLLLSTAAESLLNGRWQSKPSAKGNVTEVVFKTDNTLEGFINKKPFTSGRYFFNAADSVLCFVDNGCNNATAVYKVQFYNNADSMRFVAIADTCTERRQGMQRLELGRRK